MNEQNYQKLRDVIIKANPEIMELKFGCEVMHAGKRLTLLSGKTGTNDYWCHTGAGDYWLTDTVIKHDGTLKILGRPITFNDCVHAVRKRGWTYQDMKDLLDLWDYQHNSLDWHYHNKPETCHFLYQLLVK